MNTTENYGLKKPESNEYISIEVINENMDTVDKTMKELDKDKVDSIGGDTADTLVSAFDASSDSFPVPAAKEKARTRWGKMKKFTEDFRNWMTGVCLIGQIVNNCVTDRTDLPLSAAQGKVLMDLYTVLNTKSSKIGHTHDDRYHTKQEDGELFYAKNATSVSDCLVDTNSPGIYIYADNATHRPVEGEGNGGVILTFGFLKMWTTRIAISNDLRLFVSLHTPGVSYGEWKEISGRT